MPAQTDEDVAQYIASELYRLGQIDQMRVAMEIETRFGADFISIHPKTGNRAISQAVRDRFRQLAPDAMWSSSEMPWILRRK